MGAGASAVAASEKQMLTAASAAEMKGWIAQLPAHSREKLKAAVAGTQSSDATLGKEPAFEMSTPMLVMPFAAFKAQGRICKSVKSWRDAAIADGRLVEYAKVEGGTGKVIDGVLDGAVVVLLKGKVVIFISHTW